MNNNKWLIASKVPTEIMTNQINLSEAVKSVLFNRGYKTEKEINDFLNPTLKNLKNPKTLFDVEKAGKIILKAMSLNKKITVYGDYDVDGITATTTMLRTFRILGYKNINYYIPLRSEGYGLNKNALEKLKKEGTELLVTVDCGITSFVEIEYANSIKLPVIITDHHELVDDKVPNCLAVINPKRKENTFGFNGLAGVGTAFMLCLEILKKKRVNGKDILPLLDLVATGTVADIVPLIDANRLFVKFGLKELFDTKLLGLKVLFKHLFPEISNGTKKLFNTYDIGFVIGPTFNASGRIEDAKEAVKLLMSDDMDEIERISEKLVGLNEERKTIQNEIIAKVIEKLETKKELDYIIVDSSSAYHHGIMGIAASKITDKYYRPSILIEEKNDGTSVGSCRSIEDFNILNALKSVSDLLIKFGGHSGAAGLSIKTKDIPEFTKRINEYAKNNLTSENLKRKIKIDTFLSQRNLNTEFVKEVNLLEPFGFGNPAPLFALKGAGIENPKLIGKDKGHISFDVCLKNFKSRNAVWWNSAENFDFLLQENKKYDIAFKMKLEEFMEIEFLKFQIEDIRETLKEKSNLFYELKQRVIGDNEYSAGAKNALSSYFKEKKLLDLREKSLDEIIETLATIGEYEKIKGRKGILKYRNKNNYFLFEKILQEKFDIIHENENNKKTNFIFHLDKLLELKE